MMTCGSSKPLCPLVTADARARPLWRGPSADRARRSTGRARWTTVSLRALHAGLGLPAEGALSTMRVMDVPSGC